MTSTRLSIKLKPLTGFDIGRFYQSRHNINFLNKQKNWHIYCESAVFWETSASKLYFRNKYSRSSVKLLIVSTQFLLHINDVLQNNIIYCYVLYMGRVNISRAQDESWNILISELKLRHLWSESQSGERKTLHLIPWRLETVRNYQNKPLVKAHLF